MNGGLFSPLSLTPLIPCEPHQEETTTSGFHVIIISRKRSSVQVLLRWEGERRGGGGGGILGHFLPEMPLQIVFKSINGCSNALVTGE